ncbi:MAG TPA: sulfite exporter TauE/SafE family protein [Myxococcales bacterium]|jgi:uncharacterized membrane protein YfcA|nr:sulfite exporter TauE/SafE family protein [Myxococcales bacterium]
MDFSSSDLLLVAVALAAAAINGGLGYGFSSILVPVALLFHAGRVLNPALVVLEVGINALALFVNRRALPVVWPRTRLLLAGAVPGVIAGSLVLVHLDSGWLKLFTFSALLPLIVLQSAGIRRPVRSERAAALPAGAALGALYGATTISGPPLALLLNNQGLSKEEFRAALSLFRIVESSFTLAAYLALGLIGRESLALSATLFPAVVLALPAGYLALRRVPAEPFRRTCMAVDVLLVGFGLARTVIERHLIPPAAAWAGFGALIVLEAALLGAWAAGKLRGTSVTPVGAVR